MRLFYRLQKINGAALLGCVTIGLLGGDTAHLIGALIGVTVYAATLDRGAEHE
jgi:hypothetical protein